MLRIRVALNGPVPAREITICTSGRPDRSASSEGRPLRVLRSDRAPRNLPSPSKTSRLKSVVVFDGDSTGRTSTVKSPVAPRKPVTVIVYGPALASLVASTSGDEPVSTVPRLFPSGSVTDRIRSVDPDGMASVRNSTVEPTWAAVAVKVKNGAGFAALISPV